jgi:hypothetical protein
MSMPRPVLAPVSRKARGKQSNAGLESSAATTKSHQPAKAAQPTLDTVQTTKKKKASGVGMFGSWFGDTGDYDEEEDSKNWEHPWALPPTPLSPIFSTPTETTTSPVSTSTVGVEKRQTGKRQANKSSSVDTRNRTFSGSKHGRKSKSTHVQRPPKHPPNHPSSCSRLPLRRPQGLSK